MILHRLTFILKRKHVAIQNLHRRSRVAAQQKKGAAFFGGYNTSPR
jgi:hypothetical protein